MLREVVIVGSIVASLLAGCATPAPKANTQSGPERQIAYPWRSCQQVDRHFGVNCIGRDWPEYFNTSDWITRFYLSDQFDFLDAALDDFASNDAAFPDGRTRMSAAYAGFRDAIPTNNLDAAVAEHNARWRASSP